MEKKIITVEPGCTFLSDVMTELPHNSILNKGITGCGGTHVALTNGKHYVIAVPTNELIRNKKKNPKYKNFLFDFTTKKSDEDLKEYLENERIPVKKIMVTYDSVGRLQRLLEEHPIEDLEVCDFSILIDEAHCLFKELDYRDNAIYNLFYGNGFDSCSYTWFKSYCFMTATPLEEDFILEELKEIPVVELIWKGKKKIQIEPTVCKKGVKQSTIALVRRFIEGKEGESNAYIFVNSVNFIQEIVEQCKLTDDNARAIWSKTNVKKTGLKNSYSDSRIKKVNFITKNCFEGQDFFDENGKTFIISDPRRGHTLLDISTDVIQIAGRLRDSKHDVIEHLYSYSRYDQFNGFTYEEYKQNLYDEIKKLEIFIGKHNELSLEHRKLCSANSDFVDIDQDDYTWFINNNKAKRDLHNFKVTKCTYTLNINEEYEKSGLDALEGKIDSHYEKIIRNVDDLEPSFKKEVQNLERVSREYSEKSLERRMAFEAAEIKYPIIINAINTLGFDGITKLKYNTTNIRKKLRARELNRDSKKKVYTLLRERIKPGVFITDSQLKEMFQEIYTELYIVKTPKGSHIEEYFSVKKTSKRIDNKPTPTPGFNIIEFKFTSTDDIQKEEVESPKEDLPEYEMFDSVKPTPKETANTPLVQNELAEVTLIVPDTDASEKTERTPDAMELTRLKNEKLFGRALTLNQSEQIYNHPGYKKGCEIREKRESAMLKSEEDSQTATELDKYESLDDLLKESFPEKKKTIAEQMENVRMKKQLKEAREWRENNGIVNEPEEDDEDY